MYLKPLQENWWAILIKNEYDLWNIFTEIINDKVHSEWTISDFAVVIVPVDGRATLGAGTSAGRLITILDPQL